MQKLLLTTALLFSLSCALASRGRLVVHVVDERCGLPLPGATVTVSRGSERWSGTTDAAGDVEFTVAPGVWLVEPSLPGAFDRLVRSATVESGRETRLETWLDLVQPGSMVVEPHGPCLPRKAIAPDGVTMDGA